MLRYALIRYIKYKTLPFDAGQEGLIKAHQEAKKDLVNSAWRPDQG